MSVDLDAQTAKLKTFALRSIPLTLTWFVVLAAAIGVLVAMDGSARRLLETGVHATATVLSVDEPSRGGWSMDVRYLAGGAEHTASIHRDSHAALAVGERLTVIYDPADPGDVRTPDEPNENQAVLAVCGVAVVLSLLAIVLSAGSPWRWWRRYRAAQRTGWRVGMATVFAPGKARPLVFVRYRDGRGVTMKVITSTHLVPRNWGKRKQRVWIAGDGKATTVLFEFSPRRPRPYALPVRAPGSARGTELGEGR
jgi:hypothetical protein